MSPTPSVLKTGMSGLWWRVFGTLVNRLGSIADLGRRLPLVEAVVALDTALHRRITGLEQLKLWLDTHPGYHGIRQLRRAVELANPATESPMETRLRLLLMSNGLLTPVVQMSLYDGTGAFIARPDLYYPGDRPAIE